MPPSAKGVAPAAPAPALPLPINEQISRDARTRVVAAAAVVLVHAAYPPGHPSVAALPPGFRQAAELAFSLLVAFPVNTFVLLSFLSLTRRLAAGAPPGLILRAAARRLVPAHLFWTCVYVALRAAFTDFVPTPRGLAEAVLLGTGAAHLYFTPVLLTLLATAPLLWRFARTTATALAAGVALAALAVAVRALLGTATPWARAPAGVIAFMPFAIAGLALGRAWGRAHVAHARPGLVPPLAVVAAALSATALSATMRRAGGGATLDAATLVGANVYALSIPIALLGIRGAASRRTVRLASWSLGVYFVHPIFVQVLRAAESRIPALAGAAVPLVVPNAIAAAIGSVAAVAVLSRTPLRRVVA